MTRKGIVKEQLKWFEEQLLRIEGARVSLDNKLDRLLGCQVTMYVFIRHMGAKETKQFEEVFKAAWDRVYATDEVAT